MGPEFRLYNGKRIWSALSDVSNIIEFDSVDAVKETYKAQKGPGAGGR
jgi:hypothetical protein